MVDADQLLIVRGDLNGAARIVDDVEADLPAQEPAVGIGLLGPQLVALLEGLAVSREVPGERQGHPDLDRLAAGRRASGAAGAATGGDQQGRHAEHRNRSPVPHRIRGLQPAHFLDGSVPCPTSGNRGNRAAERRGPVPQEPRSVLRGRRRELHKRLRWLDCRSAVRVCQRSPPTLYRRLTIALPGAWRAAELRCVAPASRLHGDCTASGRRGHAEHRGAAVSPRPRHRRCADDGGIPDGGYRHHAQTGGNPLERPPGQR